MSPFADRNEALHWIIKNQLGRRNLIAPIRIKLSLLAEEYIAAQAKARMEEGKNQYTSPEDKCPQGSVKEEPPIQSFNEDALLPSVQDEAPLQPTPALKTTPPTPTEKNKIDRQNKTNYQLAQMAGVSDKTVQRYKKIQSDGSDEIKAQVDRGEISINEGYKQTRRAEKVQRQEETRERKTYTPPTELPTDRKFGS